MTSKLRNIFVLILCVSTSAVYASTDTKSFGKLTVDEVTSIYDGDTFRANIQGLHPIIGHRVPIRVAGVDTPEIRGKCLQEKELAKKAKQHTVTFLRNAKEIKLINVKRGKYFRIVAEVVADGKSLAQSLIIAGLAVPYSGGKKTKDWCF